MEIVESCMICGNREIEDIDPQWRFRRCAACGYVFDSPRPTHDEIVSFYSQAERHDSQATAERARDALWNRRLKKLAPHRHPGNILDVGAGTGQFLHLAKNHFTSVRGTEVSASAIRAAKEKYGLVLDQGQVEEMNVCPASFDHLTLFHVLEHVPNPARLVRACHNLLRADGVLIVAVPNDLLAWTSRIKKLGRRLGMKPFRKFSPVLGIAKAGASREIHVSHFTPLVLRHLLVKNGFSITEESLDPYYAARGLVLASHSAYYAVHKVWLRVLRQNRYDTIWMVARKQQA